MQTRMIDPVFRRIAHSEDIDFKFLFLSHRNEGGLIVMAPGGISHYAMRQQVKPGYVLSGAGIFNVQQSHEKSGTFYGAVKRWEAVSLGFKTEIQETKDTINDWFLSTFSPDMLIKENYA